MKIITTVHQLFNKFYLDILGPLPVTQRNNKYILTSQDDLRRHVEALPICQKGAETIPGDLVANRVLKHDTPRILQTDIEVFRNTCKNPTIRKIQSTAFHPKSQKEYLEKPSCAGCIPETLRKRESDQLE